MREVERDEIKKRKEKNKEKTLKSLRYIKEKPGHTIDREAPIHVSNVALIDPKTKKATRAGYKVEGGKKVRVSKKSGTQI